MSTPLVSLCIPTNGIVEWVIPVLESIYSQNVDDNLFEVIITDNGENSILEQKLIGFTKGHNNLRYYKTTDYQFLNQISCFKKAEGELIKFINHRMKLESGSIELLLNTAELYKDEKPVLYFLNGVLKLDEETEYYNFDSFVRALSYYSSWSAGLTIWKSDLSYIPENYIYNKWFPHTDLLFLITDRKKYIINNAIIQNEQNTDDTKKGKYNLFEVFAIEYPSVLLDLVIRKKIKYETFFNVKKDLIEFLSILYWKFVIRKKACSYEIANVNEAIKVFYGREGLNIIKRKMIHFFIYAVKDKIFRINK